MKKYKIILFTFLWICFGKVIGQTVSLPDSNFTKCLKTNFPTTINSTNQLIVSEAAKVKGTLSCTNMNIESAEGLQYFTSVTTIKLNNNNIDLLPQIPNLSNLQVIDVSDNQLESFPELSNQRRLKIFNAQRNKIKNLPDLSKNDSLTTLYVHTNQLDTIPDLSNLKNLVTLNLTYNNLKYLPNVNLLTSLETLYAWKNRLVEVPTLNALTQLSNLDLSYNNLRKTPELGLKPKLNIAYFNDNQISNLTDFSKCTQLQNVRLYNNPITFSETIKLINISKYDTIFKLMPNKQLKVGKTTEANQSQPFTIFSGIDRNVQGMSYEWFKDGNLISSKPTDSLVFSKAELKDGGKYYLTIKNSYFPTVYLKTDTFTVKVLPCFDPSVITVNSTEINCLSKGLIVISGYGSPNFPATYELLSTLSSKYIKSSTGIFEGLSESSYKLKVNIKNGCSYSYPTVITMPVKECEEVLISPDNDGSADSYYFADTGKVIIYDKRGNVIKTLAIPASWDGSTDKGKVTNGFFVADVNSGNKLIGITVLY
ncbi:MAG: hypothetical protein H7329_10415 [Opitutaceae bacterium]|nr:hypothetical protein [Cytophagales bacterium]